MTDIDTAKTNAAPAQKHFPTIWPSIGWVVLFFALQFAVSIGALLLVLDFSKGVEGAVAQIGDLKLIALPTVWALVVSNLLTLGLLWLYLKKPERQSAIGLDRWSNHSAVMTLGIAVVLIGAGLAFNYCYETYVFPDVKLQEQIRLLFAAIPKTVFNTSLIFLAGAILAPIVEEVLFRGLLQKSLSYRLPIWVAIGISALVFGAMHMDLYAFPVLAMMGAIFGLLYHLTGSLRVTILAHLINNSAALLLT
jgi:membrane protease YdiL (CAAX protease family)